MSRSLLGDEMEKYSITKYFIETGTYTGGGVRAALWRGFEQIISIEYDKTLYGACIDSFKEYDNIKIIHGDSATELAKVLSSIDEKATIFLDAHSIEVNPILEELEAIKDSGFKEHTVWIDDKREFERGVWPHITVKKLLDTLLDINPNYKIGFDNSVNGPGDIITAWVK